MSYIDCTLTIKDMENVSIEYVDGKVTRERDGKLAVNKVDMLTVERLNYWINYGLQVQEKASLQGLVESKGIVRTENPTRLEDLKIIGLILYRKSSSQIHLSRKVSKQHTIISINPTSSRDLMYRVQTCACA